MRLAQVSVEHVGRHAPAPGWHVSTRGHPHHEVVIVLSGRQRAVTPAGEALAGPGDVLLFPRGLPHDEHDAGAPGYESLFVAVAAERLPERLPLCIHDSAGRIRQLAAWLFADRDSSRREVRDACQALGEAALAEFLRLAAHREKPLVERTRAFVRQRLAEPLTLDQLAAQAGLSKYHFLRTYRREAGRSPMADVRAMRLARARDLILTTRLPLKAITQLAGLHDAVNLSRLFRRHYRMTPHELRGARGRPLGA